MLGKRLELPKRWETCEQLRQIQLDRILQRHPCRTGILIRVGAEDKDG